MQKPPAVLVFTSGDSALFERIRSSVHAVLPRDEYTVTELSLDAIRTAPWNEPSTECVLLADTKTLDEAAWTRLRNYSTNAGKVVIFSHKDANLPGAESKTPNGLSKSIFIDAPLETFLDSASPLLRDSLTEIGLRVLKASDEAPRLSHGFLVSDGGSIRDWNIKYGEEVGLGPKLVFTLADVEDESAAASSASKLAVRVQEKAAGFPDFDQGLYFKTLKTVRYGKALLYVPVATTTMDICRSLATAIPASDGIVVIARQQTNGRGRGGNEFVSPVGAAMFTFSSLLPAQSKLASSPTWIQHILAVSVVDAVVKLAADAGVESFPLRIKWPNDFYWNRKTKLGGLLVTASVKDGRINAVLGAGINVSNAKPTICLNNMLPEGIDYKFKVEEVIASALNKFEEYVQLYERKGREEFLKKYYEYWLHSREEVFLQQEGEHVLIRGLDQNGYLEVRSKEDPNKVFALMDDGNTFDMMKGLIRPKFT